MLKALPLLAVVLVGCTGVRDLQFVLTPQPSSCQAVEFRTSWFATTQTVACWNENRTMVHVGTAPGRALVDAPLEVLGSVSRVGAGVAVGYGLKELGESVGTLTIRGHGRIIHSADPSNLPPLVEPFLP